MAITKEDWKEYKRNAVKYLEINSQYATSAAVKIAIEKQIPKKMNPNFNCIHCDCGNPIYYQTDRLLHHYNYCCECGQKLDWSEVEE